MTAARGRTLLWIAAAATIAAAVLLVYGDAGSFGFIDYDDGDYVFRNAHLAEGSVLERFRWAFTAFHASNWHPLTWLSFMADRALFVLDPAWYHAENLALHGVNTLLLLALLVRSTGSAIRSALVTLLFALHPLRVESVVWVTERKGLLMALFALLALHAYVSAARRPSRWASPLVAACFAMALLAKPQAVVLPVVLLLLDWWSLDRLGPGMSPAARRGVVLAKLPLLLLAGATTALAVAAQRQTGALAPLHLLGFEARFAAGIVAPIAYLAKTLLPRGLSPVYPFAVPPGWQIAGAALLLAAITLVGVRQRANRPWVLAGWLAFLALLAPVSNIFQVGGQALADRYTYLPHIPLFVAAVWSGADALRLRPALRTGAAAAVAVLIAAFAFAARLQTAVWRDDLTLFTHAVASTRGNWKMHYNLGNTLQRLGRDIEAERHYRLALEARPNYPEAMSNLGTLLATRGEPDQAEALFTRALAIDPGYAPGWANLGYLYEQAGNFAGAAEAYRRLASLLPGFAEPHVRLGRAQLRLGRREEALAWCRKALTLEPESESAAACVREAGASEGISR